MIPKIIHYCWFGGKDIPKEYKMYISGWKELCPDFEVKEWNEHNFDLNLNGYVRKMYEEHKWAFLSDYVRLYVVYHNGGFYLDTDVELLKPLNNLVNFSAWFACEGDKVNTGLGFGAEKNNELIYKNMRIYESMNLNETIHPCHFYTTPILKEYGLEVALDNHSPVCITSRS